MDPANIYIPTAPFQTLRDAGSALERTSASRHSEFSSLSRPSSMRPNPACGKFVSSPKQTRPFTEYRSTRMNEENSRPSVSAMETISPRLAGFASPSA
jgi:hypothetical protein